MKKWIALLLALVLLLSACGKAEDEAVKPTVTENLPTPSPVSTPTPTAQATQTPEAEVEEALPIVELTQTYTVRIRQDNFPIYTAPGYDAPLADTRADAGVYTIVAECRDKDGNLWGRLKSGVGWVDVTRLEQQSAPAQTPSAPKEGCCPRCGVELTEYNTAFEGFGLCERCYDETLPDSARCDNCGMDCSFSGKEEGLCPICYEEKYPNGRYTCTKCGGPSEYQGWCDDCENTYCPMCGGPEGPDHNCDDYPNVFCPQCDWSMHTTGVGTDGITCPECGTKVL